MTKKVELFIIAVIACSFLHCGSGEGNPILIYKPPVYFAGYINNVYDSLTGNREFPNQCFMAQDTIRMFIHSSSFSEADGMRDGDFIRIDIYPGSDSALSRKSVLFHMARYHGYNASYTVSPADTLLGEDWLQFEINELDRRSGGHIDIEDIAITAQLMSGTTGGELLITKSRIVGTIE